MAEFLSIFLMVLMVAFIVLEFITPSMGLLSVLAFAALAGSIVAAYRVSNHYGLAIAVLDLLLAPTAVAIGLRYLRSSRIAVTSEVSAGAQDELARRYAALVGKNGTAVTPLRPAGTARIGDDKYDVITEGMHVDPGSPIRVVRVEGDKIVVRLDDSRGKTDQG